jgi:hypothetical protein
MGWPLSEDFLPSHKATHSGIRMDVGTLENEMNKHKKSVRSGMSAALSALGTNDIDPSIQGFLDMLRMSNHI